VKSMLVVAAELGVSTLERRVSVGLRLVNAVCAIALASIVLSPLAIARCIRARLIPRAGLSFRGSVSEVGPALEVCVPVLVSLLALVVLRAVLRLCEKLVRRRIFQRMIAARTGHCDGLLGSKGYESASFGVGVQNRLLDVQNHEGLVRENAQTISGLAGLRVTSRTSTKIAKAVESICVGTIACDTTSAD